MENVEPTPAAPVDDLWFPDGTLVIRAGAKLFKVAESILASQSTVLRDMLASPQQSYEGCPSITLTDDADDVEVFIRAIFDSNYFLPHPAPFNRLPLLGILRLSHKYDVQDLFKRALKHLEAVFPIELSRMASVYPRYGSDRPWHRELMTIGALRCVGALWLLPAAFYLACQTITSLPATREGETVAMEDIILCLRGRSRISVDHAALYSKFRYDDLGFDRCTTKFRCRAARKDAADAYFEILLCGADSDIFATWGVDPESRVWSALAESMCKACVAKAQAELSTAPTWRKLPGYFALPEWDELLAMRAAIMGDA
ncbi:hypothetical protein C8F01DRAFT_48471 [Mycena amicta]|nr:hypothetical protein C8F01DRAFT_48471 [Mycena amicta]